MGMFSSSRSSSSVHADTLTSAPAVNDSDGSTVIVQNNSGEGMSDHGLDVIAHAITSENETAKHTVNQMRGTTTDAMLLIGEGTDRLLDESAAAREDSLLFAGETYVESIESINSSHEMSFEFAGGAVDRAFDEMADFREDSYALVGDAISEMASARQDAMAFTGEAVSTAWDEFGETRDQAFSFAAGAFEASTENMQTSTMRANNAVTASANNLAQLAEDSLDRVERANRSENAALMEKLTYGALVLAALVAWRATA